MSLRVDRMYEHRISWGADLVDSTSDHYQQLAFETTRAVSIRDVLVNKTNASLPTFLLILEHFLERVFGDRTH